MYNKISTFLYSNIKIFLVFLTWRIGLFAVAFLATLILPVFKNSFPYANQVLAITKLPSFIWGFGNFDGVHYLRIAQNSYNAEYSQAFFPLYPLFIRILVSTGLINKNPVLDTRVFVDPSYFYIGLVVSNIFFLLALIIFYKLIRIDFNKKVTTGALMLLLVFPTSFYFGAIYTESLFLLLVVTAIYFTRKSNFLGAGILSALASATRIFGLLLIPVLVIELYIKIKKGEINFATSQFSKALVGLLISPIGALLYMLYLRLNFDKPLYFLTAQPFFGAERTSGSLVLLPQVLYRYLKIFLTVPFISPLYFNALLEFAFTITSLVCLVIFFKKIRLSYFIFTLGCLILPTLTGTLSSMPRYSLMIFLIFPLIIQQVRIYSKLLILFCAILEIILVSLFVRGYWIA